MEFFQIVSQLLLLKQQRICRRHAWFAFCSRVDTESTHVLTGIKSCYKSRPHLYTHGLCCIRLHLSVIAVFSPD